MTGTAPGPTSLTRTYIWAGVAVIFMVLGSVTVLAAFGRPVADILGVITLAALPFLAIVGTRIAGQVAEVKNQTNGTNTTLVGNLTETNRTLVALLSQAQPVTPTITPTTPIVEEQKAA